MNDGPDKYGCSGYGIGFDERPKFLWSDGDWGKSSAQGIDEMTITAEVKYRINFTIPGRRFVSSLYCNGSNSFLFVNAVKMYHLKARDLEKNPHPLCLGNILKDFTRK